MSKLKIIIIVIISMTTIKTYSNTAVIQVGGFSFTPSTVTVTVGDTVKWTWVSGIHTTTSVQVPTGALSWDSPMDAGHTTFTYIVMTAGVYNYQCTFHALMGMTGTITVNPTGIKPISDNVPTKFVLYQNYPNPFNPTTTIKFDISVSAFVNLTIYNLAGEEIEKLVKEQLQPGSYSVDWDATKFSSGVYIYRLESTSFIQSKKLVLIK